MIEPRHMLPRLTMLFGGLFLFALATAFSLQCNLGASSWTVLHDGIAERTPLSIGVATQIVGLLMLVVSALAGVRPGFGTLANMLCIGLFLDLILWFGLVPEAAALPVRVAMLLAGVALLGIASALYIKAGFGAGPRDSFMLALHRHTGLRVSAVRWIIEFSVLAIGILLGGEFGIGTLIAAALTGPSVDASFTLLRVRVTPTPTPAPASAGVAGDR